tara:strand:+ start:131 stop:430 length:300 start_codon:yes stop_codon:yes gene_type:complete
MKLVSFVEAYKNTHPTPGETFLRYDLREILVNPEHVVAVRHNLVLQEKLKKGLFPEDLDERQRFTKLQLSMGNGQSSVSINVVGHIDVVASKLLSKDKQ